MSVSALKMIEPESNDTSMDLYIEEFVRYVEGVEPDERVVGRLHEEAAVKAVSRLWNRTVHLLVIRYVFYVTRIYTKTYTIFRSTKTDENQFMDVNVVYWMGGTLYKDPIRIQWIPPVVRISVIFARV